MTGSKLPIKTLYLAAGKEIRPKGKIIQLGRQAMEGKEAQNKGVFSVAIVREIFCN